MARLKSHLLIVFVTMLFEGFLCSCAGIIYSPLGPSSSISNPTFDNDSSSEFTFDTSKIDFSNGVAQLTPASQLDNATNQFADGTFVGSQWDATNGYLRLANAGSCNGATSNCSTLDSSWINTDGLMGYWHFNETGTITNAVTTIADSSSRGHTGTAELVEGTTVFSQGKLQGALDFQNDHDHFAVPDSPDFTLGTKITLMNWFYLRSVPTRYASIAAKATLAHFTGEWDILLETGGWGMSGSVRIDGGDREMIHSGVTADQLLNQWTHYALTYDTQTGDMKLYLNGRLAIAESHATGNILNNSESIYIGSWSNAGDWGRSIDGKVDEFSIWNRVLTPEEIALVESRQRPVHSGHFTSRIIDGLSDGQLWQSLSWTPTLPFHKALPDNGQSESQSSYSSLANDSLMNGIVGLWHLDEPASTSGADSIKDSSGNNNNGTPQTTTMGGYGVLQSGAYFTGTIPSGISVPNSSSLNISSNKITLSAWAKFNSWYANSAKLNALVTKGWDNHTSGFYRIGAHDTGGSGAATGVNVATFNLSLNNTVGYLGGVTGTTDLQLDQWYHIVGVYDGSTSSIYVNGVLENTRTLSGNIGSGTSSLIIGNEFANTYFTDGMIDEVAVWNRALSTAEVLQLYRRGANRIKYQVRSCSDNTCSSGSPQWLGPDGTSQSYFSEIYNTANNSLTGSVDTTLPTMNFENFGSLSVSNNRYFQYRAVLESDDSNNLCNYGSGAAPCSPELKSVRIGPDHYDNSAPTIANTTGVSFSNLTSATDILGANGCTNDGTSTDATRYIFSSNNTTWYYWNGSAWTSSNQSYDQASAMGDLSSNALATFVNTAGAGKFYYKAFLKSDGTHPCEIDELNFMGQ